MQVIQWVGSHFEVIVSVLLIASEGAAAICQLLYPNNKGLSGALQTLIKLLQSLKKPSQPQS